MTKYLVKLVAKSTPENKNFPNCVQEAVYGKNQELLKIKTISGTPYCDFDHVERWSIEAYGYSRICDAKRSWVYKNPENSRFWTETAEVIAVEC